VNRYCSSGLETIAIAATRIHSGMADCIIAGGAESMSLIPMGGWRIVPNFEVTKEHSDYYWGMGLTAEAVAREYKISREDQDQFSLNSHLKAIKAIKEGKFKNEIVPFTVKENYRRRPSSRYQYRSTC
jgi:acetyl-CoA acyltransferase